MEPQMGDSDLDDYRDVGIAFSPLKMLVPGGLARRVAPAIP